VKEERIAKLTYSGRWLSTIGISSENVPPSPMSTQESTSTLISDTSFVVCSTWKNLSLSPRSSNEILIIRVRKVGMNGSWKSEPAMQKKNRPRHLRIPEECRQEEEEI
jgi:hypothetical protein